MSDTQYEVQVRNALAEHATSLNELESLLAAAVRAPEARAPMQLKEVMKHVSIGLQEANDVVENHADGTIPVSNDLLLVSTTVFRAAQDVINAVILLEATRPIRS